MRRLFKTFFGLGLISLLAACGTTAERPMRIVTSPTVGCQHLWEEPGYPGHDDGR